MNTPQGAVQISKEQAQEKYGKNIEDLEATINAQKVCTIACSECGESTKVTFDDAKISLSLGSPAPCCGSGAYCVSHRGQKGFITNKA